MGRGESASVQTRNDNEDSFVSLTSVIAELDSVDGVDVPAEQLKRECRCLVAWVAEEERVSSKDEGARGRRASSPT